MTDSVLCSHCEGRGYWTKVNSAKWNERPRPDTFTQERCTTCDGVGRHAPLPPCPAVHPAGPGPCLRRDHPGARYHKAERRRPGDTYYATDVWLWQQPLNDELDNDDRISA